MSNPPALPPEFFQGISTFATAASLLAEAAQAMAAAAKAMSEASRTFDALKPLGSEILITSNGWEASNADHDKNLGETGDIKTGSTTPKSEDSSIDVEPGYHDNDDDRFTVPNLASTSGAKGHDPTVTLPCSCGPMDISQIRLSPYPTENLGGQQPSSSQAEKNEPVQSGDLHDTERAWRDESATQPTTTPASNNVHTEYDEYPTLPHDQSFIKLQEDFDAIPIIACIALASKKTMCLVPSPDSLEVYQKILSSIPGLSVIAHLGGSGSEPWFASNPIKSFQAAPSPAMLLLAFSHISETIHHLYADTIIHWGWPEDPATYTEFVSRVGYPTRSCLLLPAGEHLEPPKRFVPIQHGITEPTAFLDMLFGPQSPIDRLRESIKTTLANTDPETMRQLYHSWLDYYGIGSTRRGDWTVIELVNYARQYAAKTLLRGPVSDGSTRFPPTHTVQLPLPVWIIEALGSLNPVTEQTTTSGPASVATPTDQPPDGTKNNAPTGSTSSAPSRKIDLSYYPASNKLARDFEQPGLHYVVLSEDIDAIPLLLYLGLKHKKTVCCVPSHESLMHLAQCFRAVTNLELMYPAAMDDATNAQAALASDPGQLMLLQCYLSMRSSPLPRSTADTLVCWGCPEDFDSYINGGAKGASRSYLLLNSEEYARASVQFKLRQYHVARLSSTNRINDLGNCGFLHRARQVVIEYIERDSFSAAAQRLYYCHLGYHSVGRGRPPGLTPEEVARRANRYAARVLLRGREEDGSRRFPPVADRPTITPGAIRSFGLGRAKATGHLTEGVSVYAVA